VVSTLAAGPLTHALDGFTENFARNVPGELRDLTEAQRTSELRDTETLKQEAAAARERAHVAGMRRSFADWFVVLMCDAVVSMHQSSWSTHLRGLANAVALSDRDYDGNGSDDGNAEQLSPFASPLPTTADDAATTDAATTVAAVALPTRFLSVHPSGAVVDWRVERPQNNTRFARYRDCEVPHDVSKRDNPTGSTPDEFFKEIGLKEEAMPAGRQPAPNVGDSVHSD
jgi:hypothetical protein